MVDFGGLHTHCMLHWKCTRIHTRAYCISRYTNWKTYFIVNWHSHQSSWWWWRHATFCLFNSCIEIVMSPLPHETNPSYYPYLFHAVDTHYYALRHFIQLRIYAISPLTNNASNKHSNPLSPTTRASFWVLKYIALWTYTLITSCPT